MEPSQVGFRRVFAERHRDVYAYCLRRTNPDDALDAAAEVFLTAWRRMEDMPDGDSVLPWLYGVARRVLSHQRRGQRRLRRLRLRAGTLGNLGPESPEAIVVRREEFALVLKALSRLRATDQEVLRLAAWDDLDHATIAGLLGCSVNAVDQRLHRARRRLAYQYRSLARDRHRGSIPAPVPEKGGET
jgi:RNA polymerase sigma-70 factor (ECF subfamily)